MLILSQIVDWLVSQRWVQYALLLSVVLLLITSAVLVVALKITAASKNRAIKESAALSAQVVLQNQGIEQMRVAGEAAERRAITATQKAAAAKREYDRRIREIMAAPVPADCAGAIKWGANQAEKLGEEWR